MAKDSRARYREALAVRDYRLLITSFIIDQVGSWAFSVVLIIYVFDRTHSPTYIALTTAAAWVPRMLFTTYGGVIADKYERTQVMVVSALLCFAAMIGLAFAVLHDVPIWLILTLSGLATAVNTPFPPATQALVPVIVPEKALVPANAIFAGLESLVVVVGPAVGGLLLLANDPAAVMVLDAISFLIAAVIITRMQVRSRGGAGSEGESLRQQLTAGFVTLGRNRVALVLVLYCALDSGVYAASTVFFVPLGVRLGLGTDAYSYLIAAFAFGGVLATGVVNRISASLRLAPVILGGMLLLALPFAAIARLDITALVVILMIASGVGMVVVDVLAITALQRSVPSEVMSRVFGVFLTIVLAALLVMSFVTASLLHAFGLTKSLLIVGFGVSALSVLGIGPVLKADNAALARVRALAPRIELLEALDMFAGATRAVLERLAGAATEVEVAAGHEVIREGDEADALWVIVDGEVDVTTTSGTTGGASRHLRTMGAGTYVGEIGLLHSLPRTATVTTTQPSTLLRISGDDFFAAVNETGASGSLMSIARSRLSTHPQLAPAAVDPELTPVP